MIARFLDDPRAVTLAALAALAAAAWWPLAGMGGMAMPEGWSVGAVLATAIMWTLMMVAMMLPGMAPVAAAYAGLAAKEDRGVRLALRIGAFLSGYLALWVVVALALAAAQMAARGSPHFAQGGTLALPWAAGALLVAAGAWQMTPVKDACLRHCRSPLAYLLSHWREGLRGAFPVGLRHGAYCVGCCIALMGLMFVFGAMEPIWMAVMAAYFLAEKVVPRAEAWSRWVGVLLMALGVGVLATAAASAKEAELPEPEPAHDALAYCGGQVTALAWFYQGMVEEGAVTARQELDGLLHLRTQMRAEAIRRDTLAAFDDASEAEIEALGERMASSDAGGAQALAELNGAVRSCLDLFFEAGQ